MCNGVMNNGCPAPLSVAKLEKAMQCHVMCFILQRGAESSLISIILVLFTDFLYAHVCCLYFYTCMLVCIFVWMGDIVMLCAYVACCFTSRVKWQRVKWQVGWMPTTILLLTVIVVSSRRALWVHTKDTMNLEIARFTAAASVVESVRLVLQLKKYVMTFFSINCNAWGGGTAQLTDEFIDEWLGGLFIIA